MNILDIEKYDNHLKYYDITSSDIEKLCASEKYGLRFYPQDKNDPDYHLAENKKMPSFVMAFYRGIDNRFNHKRVFTQIEFWNFYKKVYTFFFSKPYSFNLLQKFEGRALRTYPSLVRDLHFMLYVKEKLGIENVIYNTQLDKDIGIDLIIKNDDKLFGIKLMTSTDRSEKYKKIKDNLRQKEYSNIEFIVIPKQLDGNQFGDFFLYGEKEYNNFIAPVLK
jgi:hypothetical protein